MQERKQSSTRKVIFFFFGSNDITDIIKLKLLKRVEKIAKAKGVSMAQLSLAWIMSQDGNVFSHFLLLVSN